jgi:chromosome segregation ATPase
VAAADLKNLKTTVGELAGIAGELPALRDQVTALRKQVDSLAEAERQLSFKLARMDTYLREDEESRPRVQDELRRLSTGQEEVRQGLETQAKIMSTLEAGIRQFEQSTRGQQELIDQQAVATNAGISKVNERLEVLDRRLQAQAELATGLNSVYSTLQEVQQTFQKRLDAQAEAIRAVYLAAPANADRQEELRAALRKLEEIAGALDVPEPLPRDL